MTFFTFKFWDHRWYQKAYDELKAAEFPPEIKQFIDRLADAIPEEWTVKVIEYMYEVYKKQGEEVARAFIENLMKKLKEMFD